MKILDFLNEHINDYAEVLAQEPYCVTTKTNGKYILFSYSQLNSDFTNPIVRQCRGSIFKIVDGQFKCVCMPFYKFANYGESYADTINWSAAIAYEKIDGSLIKVWYDDGEWHVSTNNTIDAYSAMVSNYPNTSFGHIFDMALKYKSADLFEALDTNFTYMFELVSPLTRVVVPYEDVRLYYLSSRDMRTFDEKNYTDAWDTMARLRIYRPMKYGLSTLDECIKFVEQFDKNHEGLVIADNQHHRIKVKGPEYLMAAHCANNGVMGLSTAIDLIRDKKIDDFKAYCDIHNHYLDTVQYAVNSLCRKMELAWMYEKHIFEEFELKDAAALVRSMDYSDYIFKKYRNPDITAYDFLFHHILNSTLCDRIKKEMENIV